MKPVAAKTLLANVGRRIAELRVDRGLTQEALAEELGVTARWVQSTEAGGENLTLTTLAKFATGLGVPVAELFRAPTRAKARPGRPKRRTA